MGLVKAQFIIEREGAGETIEVLFNPSEYQLSSQVNYADQTVPGLNSSVVQFISGQSDQLSMTLHLDTYSAAHQIPAGDATYTRKDPQDVREIVRQFLSMLDVDGQLHTPPIVTFAWGSMTFRGVMDALQHTYTMFTESGIPVRARLEVSMRAVREPGKDLRSQPRESPDRSKQRVLIGGTQLWHMAAQEYGDPARWREIARANGIDNPKVLPAGRSLRVPALD